MQARRSMRAIVVASFTLGSLAAGVSAWAGAAASTGGSAKPGYNAIPSHVSRNVPSEGFEADSVSSFGDEVSLGGPTKTLRSMSVLLSSWGCESGHWYSGDCSTHKGATFDVPITFTIYADNSGTPGDVLAHKTETFAVKYRPSASSKCTGSDAGKWFNTEDRTCYNGAPQRVTTKFDGAVTLPTTVMWSVAYNTTHSGNAPVGESAACYTSAGGCGYDSLNVGDLSFPNAPFVGTDLDEDKVLVDGVMESGWTGFRPLGTIVAG